MDKYKQYKYKYKSMDFFGVKDILPMILGYLDDKTLCQFRLTCKQLAKKIREQTIWRIRIVSHIKRSQNRVSELISVCYFTLNDTPNCWSFKLKMIAVNVKKF